MSSWCVCYNYNNAKKWNNFNKNNIHTLAEMVSLGIEKLSQEWALLNTALEGNGSQTYDYDYW